MYPDGRVCISILHTPGDDPLGYETAAERWSPVQSIEKILLSVVSMLAEPNDESGANVDACVSCYILSIIVHIQCCLAVLIVSSSLCVCDVFWALALFCV